MKALILALAIATPVVVHAEIADIRWDKGAFAHGATIAPKKFLEACGKLSKGEKVEWQFTASGALDFNIHYHVGKDVTYPEQLKGTDKGNGTLAVPLDQDFCWMWSNKGDKDVTLDLRLIKP